MLDRKFENRPLPPKSLLYRGVVCMLNAHMDIRFLGCLSYVHFIYKLTSRHTHTHTDRYLDINTYMGSEVRSVLDNFVVEMRWRVFGVLGFSLGSLAIDFELPPFAAHVFMNT